MGVSITSTFSWWEQHGELPIAEMLGRRAARRATFLARGAALAIERVGGFRQGTGLVFGSCLGNIAVTMELLEQFYSGDSKLSPIRFMNSVHHAPASHVSIAVEQTGFVTAVAAGDDLCAQALMESLALCQQSREDVILVLCEERWPDAFSADEFEPYIGALRLEYSEGGPSITLERTDQTYTCEQVPEPVRGNPAARLENIVAWHHDSRESCLIAPSQDASWRLSRA